jgi:PadR family transcriptional regulator AphA
MPRTRTDDLLLGEWASLAVLAEKPAHGYDVALRLAPSGEVGRVWSLSRALTYRALDQLEQRSLIATVGEERGKAGGTRTVLAATRRGRALVRRWLAEPVPHFRDVRGELLLKLVLSERAGIDTVRLLEDQRAVFAPMVTALAARGGRGGGTDAVAVWRYESSRAALRFIDRMLRAAGATGSG